MYEWRHKKDTGIICLRRTCLHHKCLKILSPGYGGVKRESELIRSGFEAFRERSQRDSGEASGRSRRSLTEALENELLRNKLIHAKMSAFLCGPLAQRSEQPAHNRSVLGSNPRGSIDNLFSKFAKGTPFELRSNGAGR